ncbi:MAG: serine hydrolase domain-containing protein [Lysobacteraceae bacterium]
MTRTPPNRSLPRLALRLLCAVVLIAAAVSPATARVPTEAALDAEVARAMAATQSRGLAIAIIDKGRVVRVRSYGARNAAEAPLRTDIIMYGASLTKSAFAYLVMQLVEEGRLDLDRPLVGYLDRPLPDYPTEEKYAPWSDLAGDERWRSITARHVLTHSVGFANFAFVEPDGKLRFHFDPGARYAYSGEGMILLQFVIERGLGLDVGVEMQRRVFDRFGMKNTSMIWRPDFATDLADGWRADGSVEPHDERSKVRAAGSMDTTIDDIAKFAAGYVRGEGVSAKARAELTKPQLPITTASQFPSLQAELPIDQRNKNLAAGLGVITFRGPQGAGFMKGGHNDSTGNTLVCIERGQRCVVILANDVRAEPAFPLLVEFVLGKTGAPWRWEYGGMTFWDGARTAK